MTSVWRALMDLSKSCICICALQISGFAGLPALHLSNTAACICRQVISTLRLEQRWISPKTICVFSNSNHLHLQTGDIHICWSLLFSSLFINWNYDTYHIKYQRHSWLSFFTGSHIYALLLKSLPGDFFPHITHIEKMIEHNHFDDQVMSKLLMISTPKKNAECT